MATHTNRTPLGQTLHTLRRTAGLTQGDVATQLGLDRSTYSYYETGFSLPNVDNLKRLADIFGVSTDFLLGRTDGTQKLAVQDIADHRDGLDSARILSLLSPDERTALMWYRQLSPEDKAALLQKLSEHCLAND